MYRRELPRVYELRDLICNPQAPDAYFQNFDDHLKSEPLKLKLWLARECEFQQLDPASWYCLKTEALPYLTKRASNGRGWQQLIAVLNQARAHNYLNRIGCSNVCFIPREGQNRKKTPDLEGKLKNQRLLCEVKTISESELEIARRRTHCVGTTTNSLDEGFFRKLSSDICEAKIQMDAFDHSANVGRIAFLVVNFDDSLAEYRLEYFRQIDEHLAANPVADVNIVFYNQWTGFPCDVSMKYAVVINEAG